MMSQMSELDIEIREHREAIRDFINAHVHVPMTYDDESCFHCGSRNFERLDDGFECYDCGQLFNERS